MKAVITIYPIQDCRWDKFIESHPLGWICHTSGWKHVLERTFKHIRGHHLAVVYGEEIVAALPLFTVRSWLTGKRLVSAPFATFSDPLLSTPEDMGMLIDAVLNLSNNIGAKYVEIRITALDSGIADSRFDVSSLYKWTYLPLDCEPNELKKRFSRASIRKPLNQAIRRNLQLRIAG